MTSLFEDLGGEPALRRIIDRFVDRVFDDVMIGFFFRNARRERIKQKEYEFAARHLGADIEYTGRAIDETHRAHPIMGGQFMRRLALLKQTLEEEGVPEHVKQHWLAHTEALRPLVTADSGRECDPERAAARAAALPNAPSPHRKQER
jgi:hemoglobin